MVTSTVPQDAAPLQDSLLRIDEILKGFEILVDHSKAGDNRVVGDPGGRRPEHRLESWRERVCDVYWVI